jgi:hypothetical protein
MPSSTMAALVERTLGDASSTSARKAIARTRALKRASPHDESDAGRNVRHVRSQASFNSSRSGPVDATSSHACATWSDATTEPSPMCPE